MKLSKACALFLPLTSLLSCSSPQVLDVRPFHLREITAEDGEDPMIVGEQRRRLHGAIGVNEQAQKLGYYYTVLWDDSGSGPGEIVFEYQQGSTGSRVKKLSHRIEAGQSSGRAEFSVTGGEYLRDGKPDRVLAWRCRLIRDGREVASRHSYLWQ
ncbi:hypothetical protein [Luteolibacter marinus]|uniref:hypothetical protein n=1 Tax=Luteolibacter marinus TaxID=2776705 RepID=UPI001867429E|nr:hypothetical protein [Luteolibacter marinus]